MNSITFTDSNLFSLALTALELDAPPAYSVEDDNLAILSDDIYTIVAILHDNGIYNFKVFGLENEPDQFRTDAEADADALASAGFGTDEDYGYYGGGDDE